MHAFRFDHRSDVVQDRAGYQRGMRDAKQHGEDAAARTADEDRRTDAERGQDRHHIAELDRDIIVFGVVVVIGVAAAARIDGDDASRLRTAAQERRQFREIGHRPRQAGQADDRELRRGTGSIVAYMQTKPVLRGHEDISARFDRVDVAHSEDRSKQPIDRKRRCGRRDMRPACGGNLEFIAGGAITQEWPKSQYFDEL